MRHNFPHNRLEKALPNSGEQLQAGLRNSWASTLPPSKEMCYSENLDSPSAPCALGFITSHLTLLSAQRLICQNKHR